MAKGTFLGHPTGLFVLFFTEMWERFSYYGMRALLLLYMVDYFKWTQAEASWVYKWYTSLVYLTPLLGGYLADRYLGNKRAIIIGATLMAIGHFCMAFEQVEIFTAALILLIFGNGMFKPNMSTQVGRLYPQNDPRRDGAYTIFYMGINLGAFLSPLVCGALRDTPGLGSHWGFGAAGVGMVIGLLTYLVGLRWIREVPEGTQYEGPVAAQSTRDHSSSETHALTEEEASTAPSVFPGFATVSPVLMVVLGVTLSIGTLLLGWMKIVNWDNVITTQIAAGCAIIAGWILSHVNMAVRDRVLAIYGVFVFVVFFWIAFEQAGNVLNVWADQTTNRYLTETPPTPSTYPAAYVPAETLTLWGTFKEALARLVRINPVLTTSFQAINAAAIVVLAPLFAWLWLSLGRRQVRLSIAGKMAIGVFVQGIAFALLIWSVSYENQPSQTRLANLPSSLVVADQGRASFFDAPDLGDEDAYKQFMNADPKRKTMIAHGGRLAFDAPGGSLRCTGVLNNSHCDRILRGTAPPSYVTAIWELAKKTKDAKKSAVPNEKGDREFTVNWKLEELPTGFEPQYLQGFNPNQVRFDTQTNSLIVSKELADKDYKQILVAGADPVFRKALNDLYIQASAFRVSSWWLFWFYVLSTIGELCLSPVGLSMVSKLAPRRFATMLMGVWLLTSFLGNNYAGLLGEKWELYDPKTYFTYITLAMLGASLVCYLVAKKVTAMMHGVK
ncbi:MAG: peptide MFS transporter [Planctomycetota bacterium]